MSYQIGNYVSELFLCTSLKKIEPGNFFVGMLHHNEHGDISFKCSDASPDWVGSVVNVDGTVVLHNGAPQIVCDMDLAEKPTHQQLKACVPSKLDEANSAFTNMYTYFTSINDDPVAKLVVTVLTETKDNFVRWPAARSIHHAYLGGLAVHTGTMFEAASRLCNVYPNLDRTLLLAGVALHDIAKLQEYDIGNSGLASRYSLMGNLLGHLTLGTATIMSTAKRLGIGADTRVMALLNMIASHHGQREWGAIADMMTPEANVLHMLDNLDARLAIYQNVQNNMEPGTCSDFIQTLNTRVFKP